MSQLAIHLIPYDGIGGVETAARSTPDVEFDSFSFKKVYIFDNPSFKFFQITKNFKININNINNPFSYLKSAYYLFKSKPNLIIASLWRSCAVVICLKFLLPKTKIITFLHLTTDVHLVDKLFNFISMLLSVEIWADSQATINGRVPIYLQKRARVISFIVNHRSPPALQQPSPKFIFWGRLHKQKDISRALRIFSRIHSLRPQAEFLIIGPDGGEKTKLEKLVFSLGLESSVSFAGGLDHSVIFELAHGFSFFLQTSLAEGMSMSVVEAMQIGLIPIVTPVGEISWYCTDNVNSILISDENDTILKVLELLNNPTKFIHTSNAAISTWQSKSLYRNDVMDACSDLLSD